MLEFTSRRSTLSLSQNEVTDSVMSHYELRSSINTHFELARFAPRFYRFNDTSCLVNDDLCECLRYVSIFRIDVKMAYIILLFPKKIPNMRKRLRIAMN